MFSIMQDKEIEEAIQNHDCEIDCTLYKKCKANYLNGAVIKCLHFGNEKNFGNSKK